jgi:hypothetical protein
MSTMDWIDLAEDTDQWWAQLHGLSYVFKTLIWGAFDIWRLIFTWKLPKLPYFYTKRSFCKNKTSILKIWRSFLLLTYAKLVEIIYFEFNINKRKSVVPCYPVLWNFFNV